MIEFLQRIKLSVSYIAEQIIILSIFPRVNLQKGGTFSAQAMELSLNH